MTISSHKFQYIDQKMPFAASTLQLLFICKSLAAHDSGMKIRKKSLFLLLYYNNALFNHPNPGAKNVASQPSTRDCQQAFFTR